MIESWLHSMCARAGGFFYYFLVGTCSLEGFQADMDYVHTLVLNSDFFVGSIFSLSLVTPSAEHVIAPTWPTCGEEHDITRRMALCTPTADASVQRSVWMKHQRQNFIQNFRMAMSTFNHNICLCLWSSCAQLWCWSGLMQKTQWILIPVCSDWSWSHSEEESSYSAPAYSETCLGWTPLI